MNFLLRLVFILIAAGLFGALVFSVPVANDLIVCYDNSIESFDDIELRSRKYNWAKENRCLSRQQTILSLENCIEKRFDVPAAPVAFKEQIISAIQLIRPQIISLNTMQINHNKDCADYPDSQFIIPDEEQLY